MKQITIIESLRSFAALSVCLYHFICTTTGMLFPDTVNSIFYFGQYGVHIFFVISGFIIPWSMYQNKYKISSVFRFIGKRLIRLEPPYIISLILILLIIFIKSKLHIGVESTEPLSLKRILLHFGYLINFFPDYKWLNNVYWTLAIEFQYYLIMAFMFFLFVHQSPYIRILAYIICFVSAYFVPDPTLSHYPAYSQLFLCGISVFQFKTGIIKIKELVIILTLCFIYNYSIIEPIFAYTGIITGCVILLFPHVKIPILNWIGKMSYSIYLIHPLIGAAVINILSKYAINTIQKTGVVTVGIIVTFVCSYIMYILVEKPSKKFSSRLKL